MKKRFRILFIASLLVMFLFRLEINAQINSSWLTEVHLKDGSVLIGNLSGLHSETQEYQLTLREGITMNIPSNVIKKIVHKGLRKSDVFSYEFKEHGLYNVTSIMSFSGRGYEANDFVIGAGIHSSTGWMFNRYIGLGLGIGWENFGREFSQNLIPLFTEVRGYFFGKQNAYYYAVGTGYTFAIKNKNEGIRNTSGGWMWQPSLGIRLGSKKHFNPCFEIGFKFQKEHIDYQPLWEGELQNSYVHYYKRLTLKFGIQI
ncbi:MAG: hypothetical protein M3Q56_02935 [Bacteroidota bacterium]|nr:hypothetical protein [Bacteroidota bacterium]